MCIENEQTEERPAYVELMVVINALARMAENREKAEELRMHALRLVESTREEAKQPILKLESSNNELNEVLRLDHKGFHYNGETIQDAGKAYDLFMEFMQRGLDR